MEPLCGDHRHGDTACEIRAALSFKSPAFREEQQPLLLLILAG